MVKMGNVWDRTGVVLDGRGSMLAGIAVLALFLPAAANAAFVAYMPAGRAAAVLGLLLTLLVTVVALWGQLAIIAASTDPAVDRPAAGRMARRRLPSAVLVAVTLLVLLLLVFVPPLLMLAASGLDMAAIGRGVSPAAMTATAPGAVLGASLYTLAAGIVLLFVLARMVPLYAVVLGEARGVGAIARTWRLTRRHTWRLVGVVLLFLVVLVVATWAAQSVVGLIARLILGADRQATVAFVAALAGQVASTALSVMATVFSAQLYVALTTRERLLRDRAMQASATSPAIDA